MFFQWIPSRHKKGELSNKNNWGHDHDGFKFTLLKCLEKSHQKHGLSKNGNLTLLNQINS